MAATSLRVRFQLVIQLALLARAAAARGLSMDPFLRGGLPRGAFGPHRSLRQHFRSREQAAYNRYLARHEASRKEPHAASASGSNSTNLSISLNGNAVLVGAIRVHLIYYGSWKRPSSVIENFVTSLSQSSTTPTGPAVNRAVDWWKIVQGYSDASGYHVGKVVLGSRCFDNYSKGKDLTGKVDQVVYNALANKKLPTDSNAVYMVLTSADVTETPKDGFCAGTYPFTTPNPIGYCGWHWFFQLPSGKRIPYAFIGNPNQCVKRCGHLEGKNSTPNGDIGLDSMVNTLAHELAEAVSDYDGATGWYNSLTGDENGDLCNRKWGKVSSPKDGSYVYNLVGQGGMKWLVQLMWDKKTQSCQIKST